MRIVLIRHGETEWSASGKHTSVTDIPLTQRGREKAVTLKNRLAGHQFALVLSSPRQRALETAQLAGFEPEVDDDLVEVDYGDYEGLTTPEIRETRPGWTLWADGSPGGESLEHAGERVDRVIARAVAADGDVAVFAHGHFLRTLGARWMGQAPEVGGNLALGTAALCDLGFERERRVVWTWNDTSHGGGR